MKHIDLFSGIGGFALAAQQVWENYETTLFCDNDRFCQQVLRKRFPRVPIYGDIRTLSRERFIADTKLRRCKQKQGDENLCSTTNKFEKNTTSSGCNSNDAIYDLLTGGFPCQPFSQAGKRKGTDDNRYLWPEMLRVISDFKPTWVIAENVRGILTIEGGMVFEQVCTDLEREGYEVQPIVIPACAVNAPHRRDRVWFIAHLSGERWKQDGDMRSKEQTSLGSTSLGESVVSYDSDGTGEYVTNSEGGQPRKQTEQKGWEDISRGNKETDTNSSNRGRLAQQGRGKFNAWNQNWIEVATVLCRDDDGLSVELDEFKLSKSRHRVERLKSLGNSIVPQVAVEIMKAIKFSEGI